MPWPLSSRPARQSIVDALSDGLDPSADPARVSVPCLAASSADGALAVTDLLTMRDVVTGRSVVPGGRPLVFQSVGMSWQNLVVAEAVMERS